MSVSRNQKRKRTKAAWSKEVKRIKRDIRNGLLPKRYFEKGPETADGKEHLQKQVTKGKMRPKLTWATKDTLITLTKEAGGKE